MDTQLLIRHNLPFRNLRRLGDVLHLHAKHGWRHYLERIHSQCHVPEAVVEQLEVSPTAIRCLRVALEELGPTLVKFGQI